MEIDFNRKFMTLTGNVIPEKSEEEMEEVVDKDGKKTKKKSPPFTLGIACINVLLNTNLNQIVCPHCKAELNVPEELDGDEKLRRFNMAQKIYNRKEGLVDFRDKDIELLKDLIAKDYTTLISGQAWSILDPQGEIGTKK